MKKIFVLALAALLVVPAMAQTNKEAIKAAEKQVQEKQKELADAQRKSDQTAKESQQQIETLANEIAEVVREKLI